VRGGNPEHEDDWEMKVNEATRGNCLDRRLDFHQVMVVAWPRRKVDQLRIVSPSSRDGARCIKDGPKGYRIRIVGVSFAGAPVRPINRPPRRRAVGYRTLKLCW